jgi:hypothetical protein
MEVVRRGQSGSEANCNRQQRRLYQGDEMEEMEEAAENQKALLRNLFAARNLSGHEAKRGDQAWIVLRPVADASLVSGEGSQTKKVDTRASRCCCMSTLQGCRVGELCDVYAEARYYVEARRPGNRGLPAREKGKDPGDIRVLLRWERRPRG